VLKFIFGRETPDDYLRSGIDAFRWFQGSPFDSFPSGHAVQIMSVGTVLLLAYPTKRWVWIVLMGLGLLALVLGNWHFVSDVVAGASFGALGGAATTALWLSRGPGDRDVERTAKPTGS
jgi:membrane-associated phospholipid phosphatase